MQSQTLKRYLAFSLLVASFTLSASSAKPQERKAPANESCPRPIALTLNASTPNVVTADFGSVQLSGPRAWLNDPAPNKSFLYTFQLSKEGTCCEISRAVLTVKMKANQGGQSKTSSDAGNDGITIMYLGNGVPPFSQPVYSNWPFSAGQTVTKTWNLTGAALNHINASHRLSIYVQDDTMIQSVTLQVWGCCLNTTPPREASQEPSTTGLRN
jgi:hypothetical protein